MIWLNYLRIHFNVNALEGAIESIESYIENEISNKLSEMGFEDSGLFSSSDSSKHNLMDGNFNYTLNLSKLIESNSLIDFEFGNSFLDIDIDVKPQFLADIDLTFGYDQLTGFYIEDLKENEIQITANYSDHDFDASKS